MSKASSAVTHRVQPQAEQAAPGEHQSAQGAQAESPQASATAKQSRTVAGQGWTPEPWELAPYCEEDERLSIVAGYEERPNGTCAASWIAECDLQEDIDENRANALRIVQCVNACQGLPNPAAAIAQAREALWAIVEGAGPFSRDPLTHAANCIEAMKAHPRRPGRAGGQVMRRRDRDRAITKRAKFLRDLLNEFGAVLQGFDPGITARIPGKAGGSAWDGSHLDFDHTEWEWLEPLLVELRDRRKAALEGRQP